MLVTVLRKTAVFSDLELLRKYKDNFEIQCLGLLEYQRKLVNL